MLSLAVKQESASPAASLKPALSEEELEKKSKAIIEEYLHINDMKVRGGCSQTQQHMSPVPLSPFLWMLGWGIGGAWVKKGWPWDSADPLFSLQEALQCVQELGSPSLLYVFVQNGIESTLERSTISREHMGVLLCQLVKAGTLSKEQYYKG